MSQPAQTESIRWEAPSGTGNDALWSLQAFSGEERAVRAVRSLGMFWVLAAFAVLIPALHFFLVPAFFLVGLIQGIRKLTLKKVALHSSGTCPNCHNEVVLEFGEIKPQLPRYEMCPSCDDRIRMVEKPSDLL